MTNHPSRKQYVVTTISSVGDGPLHFGRVGKYRSIASALRAAHVAAASDRDVETYGPSALAIVGETITAVVAW